MLDILPDDIARLDDDDLRSLVGQLCEAEFRAQGLSTSGVTWGGDQNAADGGIDVRVKADRAAGGFLPRADVGFQVKKTDFTPGLIGPEMQPSGTLRPSIRTLINNGGAYIIVSSGANTSDSALKDRIEAMRKTIAADDASGALHLDFYDRSRIATWVRNHSGLMLWVRKRIGRAVLGWKSYEAWAVSPGGIKDVYLLDDKARLHRGTRDEKGLSTIEGIQRMRETLRQPRGVVRLAGLSGVGKTRLVQALFDERVGEAMLDPSLAVYADMNDNPDPQPTGMVHDLVASRRRAIVIVDNCAPDLHRRLTEIAVAADSTVSVITVEYDIQEDEPEGTDVFRLEPSTPGLVEELLKRRFPEISRVDASTIANFSGGNARVALALANTLERNENLTGLRDEELFRRLFHQRQAHDGSLLKAAQACSLLYSFQGEALSGPDAELPILAVLAGTSTQELYAKVAELKQRDLAQRRSVWRAILPHAIANRLAVMALKAIPFQLIEEQLTTERLLRSFSRRIGYLHESSEAARVVEKWLAQGGILESLGSLNELGMAMLNNIAPVSPTATLSAIEYALKGPNAGGIKDESWRRNKIGSLLRSLAYDTKLFDRAMAGLLVLFDSESRNEQSRAIQDLIVGMYHLLFSGTYATVEQRLRIVETQLQSPEPHRQALGIKLMDAMLQTGHFSSAHSFEFGARPRDYGFWPRTGADVTHWYLTVLKIACTIALSDEKAAKAVRSEIAGAFRGLWFVSTSVQETLEQFARTLLAKEYWQEGWIAIRTILSSPNERTDPDAMSRLRQLEKTLRPKNLIEQVKAVVLSQAWGRIDYGDIEEGDATESPTSSYERANIAAIELGKEVAKDDALLTTLLPDLVRGDAGRLSAFGKGLAHEVSDPVEVWSRLTTALAAIPEDNRNGGTICGFLLGLNEKNSALCETLLDEAVDDETLGAWFPILQATVPVTKNSAARLKESITSGKAHVSAYRCLAWGRSSDTLSGADLKEIILAVAAKPKGYAIATEILSMRLHSDDDAKVTHRQELIEAGRELLLQAEFEDRDNMHDYRLRMIVNACLPGNDGEEAAHRLCERFKAGLANHSVYAFNFGQFVEGLFKVQPRVALDVFFNGSADDGQDVVEVDSFDGPSDQRKNPLDALPDDEVLRWCADGGQERYISIAKAISFSRAQKDAPTVWTPISLKLLDAAPDPLPVLRVFVERFSPRSWSGSRAAIMEARERLLDDIEDHTNVELSSLAARTRPILKAAILREREWEYKRDADRDERFE